MNNRFDYNRTTGKWNYDTGAFIPVEQRPDRTHSPYSAHPFIRFNYSFDPDYAVYSFSLNDDDDLSEQAPGDFFRSFINRTLYDQQVHRNPTANVALERRKVNEHEIDTDCSICLQKYRENDEISTLRCKHSFHYHCLEKWFHYKQICPLCRVEIC